MKINYYYWFLSCLYS